MPAARKIQFTQIQTQIFESESEVVFDGSRHPYQLIDIYFVGAAVATMRFYTKVPEKGDDHSDQWIEHPLSGVTSHLQLKLDGPWSVKFECSSYTSGTVWAKLYGYNHEQLALYGARSKHS